MMEKNGKSWVSMENHWFMMEIYGFTIENHGKWIVYHIRRMGIKWTSKH